MYKLLETAFAKSTSAMYKRAFQLLLQFGKDYFPSTIMWPATDASIANFIAYLFQKGLAPSTIITYISALASMHKLAGYPDPTTSFLVKKLLSGAQKTKGSQDTRLPITTPILSNLIHHCSISSLDSYNKIMFNAICLTAFNAFLRIGEIILRSKTDDPLTVLQYDDVTFLKSKSGLSSCNLSLRSWKGRYSGPPVKILMHSGSNPLLCPVSALVKFFKIRGFAAGVLFCQADASPCVRSFFTYTLRQLLNSAGYDVNRYKGHSFRIGAATSAAQRGISDHEIQRLGRWKSTAYNKYIRIPNLHV